MTEVTIFRDGEGALCGFRAEGHAGYGEWGADIVCAAVSALTQTAQLGLSQVAQAPVLVRRRDSKGFLQVTLRAGASEVQRQQADTVMRTLFLGLQWIARDYPGHVRVICKEWRLSKCSR